MILRRIGEHVPIVRPREADRLAPPAAFDLNGRQEFLQKGQEHRAPESFEIASLAVRVAGLINRGQAGLAGQCIAEVGRRRMEAGPGDRAVGTSLQHLRLLVRMENQIALRTEMNGDVLLAPLDAAAALRGQGLHAGDDFLEIELACETQQPARSHGNTKTDIHLVLLSIIVRRRKLQ